MQHQWMMNDRKLHPRQSRNDRGELVFDLHPAKKLLREDVKAGAHVGMAPKQFQETRAEYQEFDRDIFRQQSYQEERYQKYLNWLEEKRTTKRRAHMEEGLNESGKKARKEREEGSGEAGKVTSRGSGEKIKGRRKEEEEGSR